MRASVPLMLLVMLLVIVWALGGDSALARPPQAPPVEKVRPSQAPPVADHATAFPPFSQEIANQRKPVAIFVGVPGREIDGMLICQQDSLQDAKSPCIVIVMLYTDGYMYWHQVLSSSATDEDVRRSVGWEVRQSPPPFDLRDPFSPSNRRPQSSRIVLEERDGHPAAPPVGGGKSSWPISTEQVIR